MELKEEITKILSKQIKKLKEKEIYELIEAPKESYLGDFAFPCFKLAGILKKNPAEIAEQIAGEIKPNDNLGRITANGPYINFFASQKQTFEPIKNIDGNFGKSSEGKGKKIVFDFSGPNIGKPMHVGHIRSTILGDSLMRTFNFLGYDAVGINYLGDIGLHIGKLIVAYELWLDKKALKDNPVKELLRLYVKFCENEKSEISEGQEEAGEEFLNNEWTNKAKAKLKLLELRDKRTHEIWKEIREQSGKGFDRVYKLLNVSFTETTGQSFFSEKGKSLITDALKKGLAKSEKDGAVYMEFLSNSKPQKEILPKRYVLRSNGTASYITQDIGAAVERAKKYKFEKMIYVTDYRQKLHFQQLFLILKILGYDFSDKCSHVGFGTVNFGKEIVASRTGKIVLLEDVLQKTIEKAKEEIKKRKTKGDPEKIGVGAIKYIILRNEPVKNVEFSWDSALNFEGDSGPYIQYSYARASSIIKKAEKSKSKNFKIPPNPELKETELAKKIEEFPQIVKKTAEQLNPALLANYSFALSQIFNEFYHSCPVIDSEFADFRLSLVNAFMITIKNSLYLLGIEVMSEM